MGRSQLPPTTVPCPSLQDLLLCAEWLTELVFSPECHAQPLPRVLALPLVQQHQVLQLLRLHARAEQPAAQQLAAQVLRVMASVNSGGGLTTSVPGQALLSSHAQQALHR